MIPSVACVSQEDQENMTLKVTLLSSEWKSSTNGDLSTINRELAIQLAKHSDVDVSVLLPTYDDVDWSSAESHNVKLIKAVKVPGCDPVFCLSFPPRGHKMDCVIGHGVNLGRPIAAIKMNSDYSLCKWIQVVHSDLEEDGMYKGISEGQKMRETEIKYCKMADQVITIGPKLAEAYKRYLCPVKQEKKVFDLTPSIFSEFLAVEQATEERQMFHILVTGSVDSCEDFIVKGYDIAAKAIAELKDESYKLKFVCTAKGKDILVKKLPQHGLNCNQFNVRSCDDGRKMLADLFCEVDLAIMPSRMEGFGITALEALSAALPVLVSGNSGLGEALKKVPIGTQSVVDSEDHTDWAREIKRVRQKERDVRLSESRFLREKYLAKYSWEEPCKSLVIKMKNLVFGKALYNSLDCEETERNQQSESLPVQIPIRIDCGTILDRHPRCETSGTVVIASQGTQACSDGLIVTETSEGTPQDTQDSQAGSHDLLVTGVQCEAVEPVASAGQPLAGRTGSVEEAGVGNEALPATQEVLNFIALKYFKEIGPSKPEEFNGFLHYCKEVRKVLIVDVQPGSLILTALCSSLEILDSLWYDYCTGHLNDMAQKYLVTEDVLKEFDLTELKLTTTIQMEEYIAAQKFFLQDSEKAPNTSLERKRTDGNEETKSVQGTTPCDSTEEVRAATSMALEGKAPQSSNDKEQTQRKELLTAAGNLPHSGLEVGKRDGREQSESVPAKQDLSKTKETERNRLSGVLKPIIRKFRRTGTTKMQGMLEESESEEAPNTSLKRQTSNGNEQTKSVQEEAPNTSLKRQTSDGNEQTKSVQEEAPNTSLKRQTSDGNEQTKSVQEEAPNTSLKRQISDGNEQTKSVQEEAPNTSLKRQTSDGNEQTKSVQEEAPNTSLKRQTSDGNEQTKSVQDSGTAPRYSTEEVHAATSMALEESGGQVAGNLKGKAPQSSNDKEQTQRKELLTAAGNLPHIGLEVGKRDGREQTKQNLSKTKETEKNQLSGFLRPVICKFRRKSKTKMQGMREESESGKALYSSSDFEETERNKQGESIPDSGTAPCDSRGSATEEELKNEKEVCAATSTAVEEKALNTSPKSKTKDKNEQATSIQVKAQHSSLDCEETARNKQGESVPGNLLHSGLEVGKRDGGEESESTPGRALHSALDYKETERNRQGESIPGGTSLSEDNKELNQLHSAERDSDVTEMKYALPLGFSVDSRDAGGRTPLMNAALYVNFQAVKNLIKRGADPSLVDNGGWNSLHFAAKGGDTDIIALIHSHLLKIGSKTGEGYTPLMVAAFSGKLNAVEWFLEKGATVNCVDNTEWNTLHYAAQGGDTDIISLIHIHLPNIESKTGEGCTPLMVAVFYGKLHALQWFLEKGAAVTCEDNRGWNTLHYAAQGGDTDIISLIHTHLPNIESRTNGGTRPLMVAAFCGKLHAVQWFLEKGATVTCESNRGWNTLHYAAQGGDTDILSLIHNHQPNIELRTNAGSTALMLAALCGKLHAVKWFLEKGATVNCEDNRGWNTLHHASKGGDTDTISLIHTHLPNIESKTGEGYTPLMVAAFCGKLHAVQWFLERGANPWAKDNKGEDSFYHASSCDSDVLDLLKSHVAKSAAPHDSTEQTQRNKKEAWTATGIAVEAHEKEILPYHTSRKDLADEESATVDAVDDQKTLIRRGKIGGEEGTWHLREAGASIKLCSEAVQQPVPFTCRCLLWNPRTFSPPIASDEILVSSVIELSFDGPPDPEYRESVEGIGFTVALLHSAPDLEGYEVVIKQLIDQENNEWKELKTENTWHGSETSTVPKWLFPFAQAVCAKPAVSSFAAIWRPKSFTFSRGTAVGPELTCVVPDFPDVSVEIPQSCVPVNEDFCVTIKVQEFPSSELKGEEGLVGPSLYISGSQNVTLVAPVTIRIPLTLCKEKQELAELCPGELRILHCESLVELHDWKDITDQLDEPPRLLDGIVQFKVRHFSRFCPIKLTRSAKQRGKDTKKCNSQLNKLVRRLSSSSRPQYARFLTCLCETSVDGHFGLKLFCYPQKLQKDVNRQTSNYNVLQRGEGSSGEPVRVKEKILVSLSEAIIPQDTVDKDALQFVRFRKNEVFYSGGEVCLKSGMVPKVMFYDQSQKTLCNVIIVRQVPNPVTFDHEEGNGISAQRVKHSIVKHSNESLPRSLVAAPRGEIRQSADIYEVKDGGPTEETLEFLSVELAEKWETLGRRLKFNTTAITNFVTNFDKPNEGQEAKAFKMLLAWKQREGSKATYKALYDALCHDLVECKRLAEKFCCERS